LVEDPRLRFAPDDIEGMARCVCLLAESTEFATEVAERGQQAMRRFTWAAHAEAVVEAYRFLLSPPK
jgi:glycosyltransferase involved in cell wall biosynthesis